MMQTFDEFFQLLLKDPASRIIEVKGVKKRIKGMARFYAPGYDIEYIKIAFDDHSHMIVMPSDKALAYARASDMVGTAEGIADNRIGAEEVSFRGESFKLENGNDYQFCIQVYVGQPGRDIEGEVRFWDYVSTDGKQVLSLGYDMYSGKRSDVLTTLIDMSEVFIH